MQAEERKVHFAQAVLVHLVWAIAGCLIGLLLLLLCAMLIWCEWVGESMMHLLPFLCAFVGMLIASFFAGKILKRGFLTGMLQGLLGFSLLYLLGLLVFVRIAPSVMTPNLFLSCMIGGIVGGMLSAAKLRKYR